MAAPGLANARIGHDGTGTASFRAASLLDACWPDDAMLQRIASLLADAGDSGLPALATLVETQGERVAHLHLDLDWLGQHLLPYELLCSAVDPTLH